MFLQHKCGSLENELKSIDAITSSVLQVGPSSDLLGNIPLVCESSVLRDFLERKNYQHHPCEALKQRLAIKKKCLAFTATTPPPLEVTNTGLSFYISL